MGFGSYDESEQENQQSDTDLDDSDGVSVHQNDHDGKATFETGASNEELIDQLQSMKDDGDDE
ncbi:DUF5786 family protein [Salinirubrum litoreum]|uniref:DUF5786 family protein n=1 Tax=Salinirubrum litoreum TaxID=1126234 RepID=A0ABD5R787_9EURY|nr:DUF5786 family protein [Salinirubrum litoreum]